MSDPPGTERTDVARLEVPREERSASHESCKVRMVRPSHLSFARGSQAARSPCRCLQGQLPIAGHWLDEVSGGVASTDLHRDPLPAPCPCRKMQGVTVLSIFLGLPPWAIQPSRGSSENNPSRRLWTSPTSSVGTHAGANIRHARRGQLVLQGGASEAAKRGVKPAFLYPVSAPSS